MLSNKPRVGIVFSVVAGILMLIVWVGSIDQPIVSIEVVEFSRLLWAPSVVMRLCFVMGWAVFILIGALVLYVAPKQHSIGGTIILTFSTLTLLLWAGGFILRYLTGVYIRSFFPFLLRGIDGSIEILSFDVLTVVSIFGIMGGVSGVLWKTKSAVASVKESEAKLNLLGVVSAIMAFNSLALPWWVGVEVYSYTLLFPWGEEGIGRPVWLWFIITLRNYDLAMYVALAFILISGILALLGSLMVGRKGRILLVVAGIFAVLSMASFATGLESSLDAVGQHTFYISEGWLHYLSFGFWIVLVAAILAFVASLRHPPIPVKTPPS